MVIVNSPAWLPVAASWDWALVTAAFWLGMSPGLTSANTRRTVSRPAVVCRTAAVRFARSTPALIWLTRKMPINSTPIPVTTRVVAPHAQLKRMLPRAPSSTPTSRGSFSEHPEQPPGPGAHPASLARPRLRGRPPTVALIRAHQGESAQLESTGVAGPPSRGVSGACPVTSGRAVVRGPLMVGRLCTPRRER